MINTTNLAALLQTLGFEESQQVYSKHFTAGDFYLKVDFNKQQLIYPEDKGFKINERQTCSFSSPENFVVFECVHRLLMKGYKPEHIELEPKWKSGHGASGGRADIMVRNQTGEPILIIECKTAGKEFDKAWRDTKINGGQLLAYADRERTLHFVCLYTSDWIDNRVVYENYIIPLADIQNLVEQYAGKEIKPLFYKDVKDVKQWHQVWTETYKQEFLTTGIFEEDIQAYNIGQQKLTLKDLKYITGREMQGKFHEFAEILRKFNVSSKESAFDKLINLFLCKIVDENQAHYNGKDLEFNWRGNYADDYFSLIDRLQKLYRDGMEEYLGEKITFIDNKKVMDAFGFYKDRNATRDYVLQLFKQQKYFTNSDFGFIDVHNDKLFYQNAEILLEVIKMWQQYQLNGEQQNQFLGDMFEGFLDKGFKQSEGQFFTPIPICKFILSSLPIEQKLYETDKPPRVIDYACGSGHFLTEYAAQIRPLVEQHNSLLENPEHRRDIKAYYKNVFGVEKEYRLSKVAKMSAFMYGQDEINVIYCDALKNIQQEIRGQIVLVEEETCDILIANPPFAVDGFLTTLTQNERENYTLFNKKNDLTTQNNIQCFFLERAKQLLKGNGVTGVIVPSSVLSNSDSMHIATREILLKYFDFVSIVELGSGTFGKTGTNTVILFLRRKAQKPEPAIHYWNRTLDFFEKWEKELATNGGKYNDLHLIRKYCQYIDIAFDDYQILLKANSIDEMNRIHTLYKYDIFKDYKADFDNLNDTKKLKEAKTFKAKTQAEQDAELNKRFVKYLQTIEQQKLYYFILAQSNPQKVLIVKSPADDKEQKQFLGYKWSGSKGSEGIKYNGGNTANDIITPMFDPKNRQNADKINYYIQQNFIGTDLALQRLNDIPAHLQPFVTQAHLVDLLDFSRKDFNKAFSLTPKTNRNVGTRWELVKLGEVCKLYQPKTISGNEVLDKGDYKVFGANGVIGYYSKYNHEFSEIAITCRGATCGTINMTEPKSWITGNAMVAQLINDKLLKKYLFEILSFSDLSPIITGSAQPQITRENLSPFKIPLPPLSIQQQIVAECEAIDTAVESAKIGMEKARAAIEEKVREVYAQNYPVKKLDNIVQVQSGGTPKREVSDYWNGTINWVRSEVCQNKYVYEAEVNEKITELGLKNSSAKILKKDTILIALVGATIGKLGYLTFETTTNQNVAGVYPKNTNELLPKFLYFCLLNDFESNFGSRKGSFTMANLTIIKNLTIPVPPLAIQSALVAEIEVLEQQIASCQSIIDNAAWQKQEVLSKYL